MAITQKQQLENAILIVSEWHANRLPDEIIALFFNLEDLDQSKDEDLWEQLEQAIKDNNEFKFEGFQLALKALRNRTKKGYWWWDLK